SWIKWAPTQFRQFATFRNKCAKPSGPLEHCHQTCSFDPATTSSGVRFPFLVGCHCAAMPGKRDASELVTETLCPVQKGHFLSGFRLSVREWTEACHSWSRPLAHSHQTRKPDRATTLLGVRSPFFVGCHSAAMPGKSEAKELVIETFRPLQYGQPCCPV